MERSSAVNVVIYIAIATVVGALAPVCPFLLAKSMARNLHATLILKRASASRCLGLEGY
jgi:VIT1/CCC1 family predicted Fe2+/Mn2+ transporter